jgi:solute:Na+ symporter, SSS family
VVTIYVIVSGVRGSAWTAVVKDTLILATAVFLGIYLPVYLYGGYGPMFAAINAAKPGFLALPAMGESIAWFDSTVLLTALGFLVFVLFAGFAAVLEVPGLKGSDIDLSLFRLSINVFDPWFVGVIGAAGVLTALVPGSMILMTAATLLANNVSSSARRRRCAQSLPSYSCLSWRS